MEKLPPEDVNDFVELPPVNVAGDGVAVPAGVGVAVPAGVGVAVALLLGAGVGVGFEGVTPPPPPPPQAASSAVPMKTKSTRTRGAMKMPPIAMTKVAIASVALQASPSLSGRPLYPGSTSARVRLRARNRTRSRDRKPKRRCRTPGRCPCSRTRIRRPARSP